MGFCEAWSFIMSRESSRLCLDNSKNFVSYIYIFKKVKFCSTHKNPSYFKDGYLGVYNHSCRITAIFFRCLRLATVFITSYYHVVSCDLRFRSNAIQQQPKRTFQTWCRHLWVIQYACIVTSPLNGHTTTHTVAKKNACRDHSITAWS